MVLDSYWTIAEATRVEQRIKDSRFIAQALPAATRSEAEAQIASLALAFHDASHNCYAYRVGLASEQASYFSDAGEPSGTAGRPILNALEEKQLTNVLVVVTRYFGGTRLGTGGLVRAYSSSARMALAAAKMVERFLQTELQIVFPYRMTNVVIHQLQLDAAEITAREYDQSCRFRIRIRQSRVEKLIQNLINATAGEAIIQLPEGKL